MDKTYYASSVNKWNYIGIDGDPPSGKVHVLTKGGISTLGTGRTHGIIAWAPLMLRDKQKEGIQILHAGNKEAMFLAGINLSVSRKQAQDIATAKPKFMNCPECGKYRMVEDSHIGRTLQPCNGLLRI